MYYIIEHQIRPDGQVNVSQTGRSTFTLALSYFHERAYKMVATELYTKVHLLMVDEELNVIKTEHLETSYKAPEAETETEQTEGEA